MKLALLGGGGVRSVFFTKSLLKRAKRVGINELILMDNDEEKLDIYGQLCIQAAKKIDPNFIIRRTTDIREAVNNVDFVVTTMRVGKEHARVLDEKIPLKYGILGQETTGPGGFCMALRTIPVMLDYCKIIKELSPNAWIFNFTNPSGLVTEALRNKGYDRVIGICDSPSDLKIQIAKALNLSPKDLKTDFYGLNHLSWIKNISVHGEDITKSLVENPDLIKSIKALKVFDMELIKMIGQIPNEYLYYYYHRETALSNILNSKYTRGETIEIINQKMLNKLKNIDIEKNPDEALEIYYEFSGKRIDSYMSIETGNKSSEENNSEEEMNSDGYAGVALDIIEALNGESEKELILSIPNNGAITEMKNDDIVEITCKVSKIGPNPIQIGSVPEPMLCLMKSVKLYEKLTIEAIENKSKSLAYEALIAHPLVGSYSLSKSIVDEYLEANKKYVGVWK